jgi:uridine kinase
MISMLTLKIKDFLENGFRYIPPQTRIISVAGGSGSGKSCFSKELCEKINAQVIELDDYIIPETITPESNWDLPGCWDLGLTRKHLEIFLKGNEFKKPVYHFKKGTNNEYEVIYPGKPIILEGLYSLHDSLKDLIELGIFMDISEKERLNRVLKRDILERGKKTQEKIIKRWNETIQPAYLNLVEPQKNKADFILT